jgi:hypothetical protein
VARQKKKGRMTAEESTGFANLQRRKPGAEITCLNSRPQNLLPPSGKAKHDRVLPRRMNGTGSCRRIEIVVMNELIVGKKRVLAMALRLEITTIIWMVIG